jgi:RecA/RadA recombinase
MAKKKRVRLRSGGRYFDAPTEVSCISSGAALLDCCLGGGWAEGRTGNIVGDKSTGKTLLCIELCANFVLKYPHRDDAFIRYGESEAAFDIPYAETIGLPTKRVQFNKGGVLLDTVEEWYDDLEAFCDKVEGVTFVRFSEKKQPGGKKAKVVRVTKPIPGCKRAKGGLYILDSLDALSDADELVSKFGADSYGTKKPKLIGQLFRRIIRRLSKLNVTLIITSQEKSKIGVMFGDKTTRAGGRALDYYASQIIWLSDLGKTRETKGGVKRVTGFKIRVRCKKNKVGLAWRDVDLPIRFAYGLDEFDAGLSWLLEVKMLGKMGLDGKDAAKEYLHSLDVMTNEEIAVERKRLVAVIKDSWWEVERRFLPTRKKYA